MYRTIDTSLWSDPNVRKLKSAGKLLFLYLITNPHAHVSGIYYLPPSYIIHDTGLPQDTLDRVWHTLSDTGLAKIDAETDVVWVCNMFRYQGHGIKTTISASHHLKTLHNSILCKEFAEKYPEVLGVKNGYRIDGVSIGYPAQGSQKQEQEQNNTPLPPKGGNRATRTSRADPEGFAEFWQAYPRKQGRQKALQAWLRLSPDAALRAVLMDALVRQKRWPQWIRDEGAYVPHASTWLRGRRWEDQEQRPATATEPSLSPEERAARQKRDRDSERAERERLAADPQRSQKVQDLIRQVGGQVP